MPSILIVEDSPTALYMTSKMLKDGGYDVLTARDGEQAVKVATEEKPGLVLLDVILPKLNGYQVCRQLKGAPETEHIPVVMITSKTKDSDRHWGMEQGADDYITKPFEAKDLLAVINRFFAEANAVAVLKEDTGTGKKDDEDDETGKAKKS